MTNITIRVTGIGGLNRKIKKFEKRIRVRNDDTARTIAQNAALFGRMNLVPYKWNQSSHGQLADSITAKRLKNGEWSAGPDRRKARYAGVVEKGGTFPGTPVYAPGQGYKGGDFLMTKGGSHKIRGKHYMRKAFQRASRQAKGIAERNVKMAINESGVG